MEDAERFPRVFSRPPRLAVLAAGALGAASFAIAAVLAGAPPARAADPSSPPSTAVAWAVQPATASGPDRRPAFEYALDPGAVVDDYVSVSNVGGVPLELRVYATDAFSTDDGGFALLTGDQAPTDVGSWIQLPGERFTVPPMTRLDIPFRVTVPAGAEPGDHAGGIVASLETEAPTDGGAGVLVDRRVGSRVYLQVNGPVLPSMTIDELTADYDAGWNPLSGTLTVRFRLTNTGNIRLAARQAVSASGPFGLWGRDVPLDDLPELLPGGSIVATTTVRDVPPLGSIGTDLAIQPYPTRAGVEASVDPLSGSTSAWALPILLVGLVLIAAEGVVALVLWRRRRAEAARVSLAAAIEAARLEGMALARGESAGASEEDGTGDVDGAHDGDAVRAEDTGPRDG